MKIRNCILNGILVFAIGGLAISGQYVAAAGAELPISVDYASDIKPAISAYDIYEYYDSYMGDSTGYTYEITKQNGDIYCYEGKLNYRGRKNGIYGDYIYRGDQRDFKLYQIIKADGSTISPFAAK